MLILEKYQQGFSIQLNFLSKNQRAMKMDSKILFSI
jgi:hypothetical protein